MIQLGFPEGAAAMEGWRQVDLLPDSRYYNAMISRETLVGQLRALGLPAGAVVVVHTSFKKVGPVEGGPVGLIAALREAIGGGGTLVMPAMSDDDDVPFVLATTPCRGMGVVADTFRTLPEVRRSDNPASFAAVGPLAEAITAPHPLSPPHGIDSPVGRAAALGGYVLLLGVGHSEDTTMHLAEAIARVPYRVRKSCVVNERGAAVSVEYEETDHCCQGFSRIDGWLRARSSQREGTVGNAEARLIVAAEIVRVAVGELIADPCAFLHPRGGGCDDCDAAWDSIPR
jgi:aminoglycoside 3-N-acetyltransferase